MGAVPKNSNRIIFFNMLSTVLLQGMAFLAGPIFSRMLGTENYGVVSIFNTWVSFFAVALTLQPANALTAAKRKYPEEEQKAFQSSMLFLSLCFFVVCAVLAVAFLHPLSQLLQLSETVVVLALICAFASSCVGFLNAAFTYDFYADRNFFMAAGTTVANIGLSIVLINVMDMQTNYMGRILGITIVNVVAAVAVCVYIWGRGKCFVNPQYWQFAVPLVLPLILHSLSNLVLCQSDRIMLQWFKGSAEVGVYSLAFSFASVMASIWNAFNNSWVAFFHDYMRKKQLEEVKLHAKNYLELFTVLTVGFVLLTTEVYHWYAPSEFWGGENVIYAIVLAHYITLIYSFAVNYEMFHLKTKVVAVGTLAAAAVNIVLNLVFLQFMGATGVAIATALSTMFKCIFHHFNAKRMKVDTEYPFATKMFLPYIIAVLSAVALALVFLDIWWLRWGLGACIGVWELYRIYKRKVIF